MLKLGAYRNGGFGDGLIASAQVAGITRYFASTNHEMRLLYWGSRVKEICDKQPGISKIIEARETPSKHIREFDIWFELKPCPMFCSRTHLDLLPKANLRMLGSALQVDKDYWGPLAGNDIIALYEQHGCVGQLEFLSKLTGIPMSIHDAHLAKTKVLNGNTIDGPYIAFCGGQRAHKKWLVPGGWEKVARHIIKAGFVPVQLGAPDETSVPGCAWRKHIPMDQQIALLRGATAFVGCDGFLCHVAAALDIPSVVLWGGTPWRVWGYRHQTHIVAPSENCWWVHMKPDLALLKSQQAMSRISAEAVTAGVDKVLQNVYTDSAPEKGIKNLVEA